MHLYAGCMEHGLLTPSEDGLTFAPAGPPQLYPGLAGSEVKLALVKGKYMQVPPDASEQTEVWLWAMVEHKCWVTDPTARSDVGQLTTAIQSAE